MSNQKPSKSIPAKQEVVKFGDGVVIEGYLLETGEIRYSKAGAATLLRETNNWINELESKTPDLLKALRAAGYTDSSQKVSTKRPGKRGATIAETISGDDLDVLITVEAQRGNKRAVALLSSGWRQYRIDQSRTAFNLAPRTESEKLLDFDAHFEAIQANYDDWADISEQEEFIANPTVRWLNKLLLTANCYEDDPDCHQSK